MCIVLCEPLHKGDAVKPVNMFRLKPRTSGELPRREVQIQTNNGEV